MKRLSTKRDGLLNFSDYKTIGNKIAYGVFIFLDFLFNWVHQK